MGDEIEISVLTSRREHVFRSLQILYDIGKSMATDKTKLPQFRARFKSIDKLKEEFEELTEQINLKSMKYIPKFTIDNQKLNAFDELYYEIVAISETILYEPIKVSNNTVSKTEESRLQIRLPKFDGQIEHWQTFIDSYLSLIHKNGSLNTIDKFHYLISCLSGPALSIAKGVPLTSSNYDVVFNTLLNRYQNKRILATTYLDKILKLSPLTNPNLEGLTKITNTLYESVNALRALKLDSLSEFILFYLATRSLDSDTRKCFEVQNISEAPSFDELLNYLQNYIRVLEVSKPSTSSSISKVTTKPNNYSSSTNKQNYKRSFVTSSNPNYKQFNCSCCNLPHSIFKCPKMQELNISSRKQLINDLKLCTNCLRPAHSVSSCPSKTGCLNCGEKHHTLLHVDPVTTATGESTTLACATEMSTKTKFHQNSVKILGLAIVRIRDARGIVQCARALIDSCSHDSFMTTSCVQRLGLPTRRCRLSVSGIGENVAHDIKGYTHTTIMPHYKDTPIFDLSFIIIPKITSQLPTIQLPNSIREHFDHLNLADKNFDSPAQVDLLLGVEIFHQIYDGRRYSPGPGLPCALSSIFGWVITGQYNNNNIVVPQQAISSLITSTHMLDDAVRRFWEVEEPPHTEFAVPEHQECEDMYSKLTYRDPSGRYVVPIMLKADPSTLGDSYRPALTRFLNIEKRHARDSNLKSEYATFMQVYEDLGHMLPSPHTGPRYLIPHHGVVRPSSTTTRLRVVFDASCRTSTGLSLNDIVHTGPKLQNDLVDLITLFRLHKFVFTCDICKMYRQISIRPEDRPLQHILWRASSDAPLVEYQLNTVTYGVSSSPYLAIRTLRQLAADYGDRYPSAAKVLCHETFMDDITTGCSSLEEAISLKNDLISLLGLGKFDLRKWSSNSADFLSDVPTEHCQVLKQFSDDGSELNIKILGNKWDPSGDYFSYSVSAINITYTKRGILSTVSRIFDPVGWISPVVFATKLLLQDLWRHNLDWDQQVPTNIARQWQDLASNINDLKNIKLPRFVLPPNPTEINLVGFCDGSSKGYGVVQINDLIDVKSWRHVSTHENPADCCSRGVSCSELATHDLWWSGPPWLLLPMANWPSKQYLLPFDELPELKPASVSNALLTVNDDNNFLSYIERFSTLTNLKRTFAWCIRFIRNCKLKQNLRVLTSLSSAEINSSFFIIIKFIQIQYFKNEISLVSKNAPCIKTLQKLSPFLDSVGILRVGGRIRNANLPLDALHPILLPKQCYLSKLIIDHYHNTYLHCGPRTLQSLIQRKFWIIGMRLLIRSRLSKCVICFKAKPVPCQPRMGDLPAARLQPGRCFQTTGIDFGGPFLIKESKRRNARTYKAYICLFLCLTVKAVHLEAVTELSSEAFLAALDRFIARRGLCQKILTDCGTNFVGANRHLNEIYTMLHKNKNLIQDNLTSRQINWKFNPPGAPHFGGIFESGIKSTKYHLKRVVGEQVLTLEEMFTVLSKVEAMLNSRPLCALSSEPTEIDVLTPGHFLVGGPLVALSEYDVSDDRSHPRTRWQMVQKITQSFWNIWQRDYLHTLQQKVKWFATTPNLKENDLVMLMDPNLPPNQWKLARVERVHPGRDGVVRVATVHTAHGTFRRPVVKLCPLPIN